MLRQGHQRAAWAQDSRLFAGDLGDRVAQVFLVVERDVGEDGEQRIDDVGGVEPAAHAHFQDGDLHWFPDGSVCFLVREVQESQRGQRLEEARMVRQPAGRDQLPGRLVDAKVEARKVFLGNLGETVDS